ncbi:MAG: GGDEF domain-containing protein [Hahellaceae bacterium]|nr:GGDEF domain-containing protein [Hahellaceae bacterium]MCP5168609.1 GGDEF domain-containing protein [Hahellaceae bacterium]
MTDSLICELEGIIAKDLVCTLFQPLVEAKSGQIFGYEALTRGPHTSDLFSPVLLFDLARSCGLSQPLEFMCIKNAVRNFVRLGLPGKLFLNLSPDCILSRNATPEAFKGLFSGLSLSLNDVVVELTEQANNCDMAAVIRAVNAYQDAGICVALDDLGAGHSSLQLWSSLKPKFVKLDRHFVTNIDADVTKQEFVRSFTALARSTESRVIAEGIETEGELNFLRTVGIDLAQGYLICHPRAHPPTEFAFENPVPARARPTPLTALSLVATDVSLASSVSVARVGDILLKNPALGSIAIVDQNIPVGLVQRVNILNELSRPFGRELHGRKPIVHFMERDILCVDSSLRIDQVSRLITSRARFRQEEDFVITQDGRFLGLGQVVDVLRQITELQIQQARQANPLTLLPGIIPLNDCIESLIEQRKTFAVSHFDIDHFKPFNDIYGYAKGDEIILCLSNLLKKHTQQDQDVCGHIGGDDFIVLWSSDDWIERVRAIQAQFSEYTKRLYRMDHVNIGGFSAADRFGEMRFFPLASLSVAALKIRPGMVSSHHDVSSRLSPLKHAAKLLSGNSLVLDHPENLLQQRNDEACLVI